MKRRINPLAFSAAIISRFVDHGFLEREIRNSRTYYYITKSGIEEIARLGVDYNIIKLKSGKAAKKPEKKTMRQSRKKGYG